MGHMQHTNSKAKDAASENSKPAGWRGPYITASVWLMVCMSRAILPAIKQREPSAVGSLADLSLLFLVTSHSAIRCL